MSLRNEIINGSVQIMSGGVLLIGLTNTFAFLVTSDDVMRSISPKGVLMALPTAIALSMVGLCLLALSRSTWHENR